MLRRVTSLGQNDEHAFLGVVSVERLGTHGPLLLTSPTDVS
jgi:hypothetical protein